MQIASGPILLAFAVVGELRAGFAHGRRQAQNERVLRRFLLKDGARAVSSDRMKTPSGTG